MKKYLSIAAIVFMVASACAQNGFGGVQSYSTTVFNAISGPSVSPTISGPNACTNIGTACAIQNYGTSAHWVMYCIVGGNVFSLALELEGSDDQQNWGQISTQGTAPTGSSGCGILEGAGYFKWLRVNVIALSGVGQQLSVWYSGIASPISNGGGLILGNKPSTPVVMLPTTHISFSTLKSAGQTISSGNVVLYELSFSNPNTVPVFVAVSCNGAQNLLYEVAPNAGRDVALFPGENCLAVSQITCSTSATSFVDPVNACLANVHLKGYVNVNTQVGTNGTVRNTTGNIAP